MTDIELTPLTAAHIPQIQVIEQSVFTTPWTEEMFRQELLGVFGSRAVVALRDGCVIGYRIAWFLEDEVHLVNIAVREDSQAQGVGRRLLMHLIEEALVAQKRMITLEVRAGNVGAQEFYKRFFFRAVGVRKGYYSDNREDALLMVLDLEKFVRRRDIGEETSQAG